MIESPELFLRTLFDAAVAAVSAERCLLPHLPPPPAGRTLVVGAGKAAAAMARVVEAHWQGPLSGLVVTRYGHSARSAQERPLRYTEVVEAGHPVPDRAGQIAATRILALATDLEAEDLLLCLLSGGGSALLSLPAPGLRLDDKQRLTKALLRSGATIAEINCVRKHLSAIKGGRLAVAAAPAQVVTLAISDVPGDDPVVIASGPTLPDPTTTADALAILHRYDLTETPPLAETPKPGTQAFLQARTTVIATAQEALEGAAAAARRAGVTPVILSNAVEGEAREVALVHAAIARQVAAHDQPFPPPCVLLSGGETTVTVRGNGRGGRNSEFLLALLLALDGHPRIHALACGTDGIDGTEDNAGAVAGPETLRRGRNPQAALDANNSYDFFLEAGGLVVTGPTQTNVSDFRAIFIGPG
ncbi:MAG: glycerate kinase [Alphaproteobacteria bacterium]|nr:glycerate kinase [Alphaproteobacteria bacterium]